MHLVRESATCRAMRAMAMLAVAALAPLGFAKAQVGDSAVATPTLQSIEQAVRVQDFTAVQIRRFPAGGSATVPAQVTSVRERLEVAANGTANPAFALTFLGVEGETAGSPRTLQWQQTYARHAGQFFAHGSFRVRDLAAARTNYTVHDFGAVARAGRPARRLVVFPSSLDKSIWMIEVDLATSVTLYAAEFDARLALLAEVETISFVPSVGAFTPHASGSTAVADFTAAHAAMGHPVGVVEPALAVTSEYGLDRVEVQNDPLNGAWKLTMTYTDGVDQFVIVQAPGTPDSFAGLPGKSNGGAVIGRFRDAAMTALVFWEGGVSFQVAGRGSLLRLDALAQHVYLQALASN